MPCRPWRPGRAASSGRGAGCSGPRTTGGRGGVDLDDGRLGEGVGADELVVGGVVGHDDRTGLARAALRAPGEVTAVEAEGPVLVVAAVGADGVYALVANASVGGLAAWLGSAFLPCRRRSERMLPPLTERICDLGFW